MTTRSSAALLRRYVHGLLTLTDASPTGRVLRAGTLAFGDSGTDLAGLNAVVVTGAAWSFGDLDRVADLASAQGCPWSIAVQLGTETVRDAARLRAVERVAAAHGLAERDEDPFLASWPDDVSPGTPPSDRARPAQARPAHARPAQTQPNTPAPTPAPTVPPITVDTVPSVDWVQYTDTVAAGFGLPAAAFGSVFAGDLLDIPAVRGYLARSEGRAVASGLGIVAEDALGVYNIAVAPDQRSRGVGRAVTERVLRDGFQAGATAAYLVSSAEALPLYRSLGFRQVDTLVRWSTPSARTGAAVHSAATSAVAR